ncbi:phage Mu protein F like protein [Serratia fonticola]|uniref:Phage Mu protein F like protein n=1 Tax=Serratia fonticola TaxID=47917 RepID=A0A542D856_SERFO|nr:PBECR2 nuclease fold domain-containing protein [Serratia fonticola]TQI78709.1 phage Mu protein F like protein [Serratia fonticola]TQI99269.1 phage Mu protein F like protein [Serratia fonticola]TVZ68794.1 phage Mu protein F like protein [Serratia fonticola]
MASISYGSLPFSEQIAFFRRKTNLLTQAWTDIYNAEHDYAFVVAGANRDDLLADLRRAVEHTIAEGGTLADFRRDFAVIVERYGWSYNGGFGWRTRVIFDTNLRSSYMAGRYEQLYSMRETMPYWEYQHSDAVEEPREEHLGWDGMILRWDDPWWSYFFPPNGWGCQCGVRGRSEAWMKRHGKTGPDTAPPIVWEQRIIGQRSPDGPRIVQVPKGIDPSFEHAPGRSRLDGQVPPPSSTPPGGGTLSKGGAQAEPLPPARQINAEKLLSVDTNTQNAVLEFLSEFGATRTQPAIFKDIVGESLVIGAGMFMHEGSIQVTQSEQTRYLSLLAEAIKRPDEIWTGITWSVAAKVAQVWRRYIARFTIAEEAETVTVVAELGKNGWSSMAVISQDSLAGIREGALAYRRTGDA